MIIGGNSEPSTPVSDNAFVYKFLYLISQFGLVLNDEQN
jgi:hypothetical protein